MYTYKAKVEKIVDGDTIDLIADLGFETYRKVRCRLARIDAAELSTAEGKKIKKELNNLIPVNTNVIFESKEYDKYKRSIAEIYLNNINISDYLINKKLVKAVKY